MTQQPPPVPQPDRLSYATPLPPGAEPSLLLIWIRKLILATGVGLFCGGAAYGYFTTGGRDEASTMIGIGAGLVTLVVPWPKWPRSQ